MHEQPLCIQIVARSSTGERSMRFTTVNHREPSHSHRKNLRELLEPVLDPLLAVEISLAQQAGATNTTGHAVVPASQTE